MTLFLDGYQTAANGINDRRLVVGQIADSNFLDEMSHAAVWQNGVVKDLGTLGGPDPEWFYCSGANGVNDFGHVVGWSSTAAGPEFFPCDSLTFYRVRPTLSCGLEARQCETSALCRATHQAWQRR